MAPDRRADVFALGTSLWEISVNRRLFKQDSDVETVRAIHRARVPDPRQIFADYPERLARVLMRALARDVDERYATAAEMARDLEECVEVNGRTVNAASIAAMMTEVASSAAK